MSQFRPLKKIGMNIIVARSKKLKNKYSNYYKYKTSSKVKKVSRIEDFEGRLLRIEALKEQFAPFNYDEMLDELNQIRTDEPSENIKEFEKALYKSLVRYSERWNSPEHLERAKKI